MTLTDAIPPRIVLTYGTFDLFHYGHERLLSGLAAMGTQLIVGLSTDAFNAVKGKHCAQSFDERRETLERHGLVSRVIPEVNWEQKRTDIVNLNVSVFGMGSDWTGHFDHLRDLAQVIYLPRTEGISSTELRAKMLRQKGRPTSQSA